jgi:elongator complex protein 3
MSQRPEELVILKFAECPIKTRVCLDAIQKEIARSRDTEFIGNDRLLQAYRELVKGNILAPDPNIERLLRSKSIRSLSGIVVISVLTKPYPCPGQCLFCPTVNSLPKSYVENEPAVMRAQQNQFDPYRQTYQRLQALENTGHPLSKINLRVIGGTWSYYPKTYQTGFISRCFQACNDFGRSREGGEHRRETLEQAQKRNETASCRLVEISVETRQDFIDLAEIVRLRRLGVTKVELGVQSLWDDVLKINRRGHGIAATSSATRMLKDAGFKISYQIMPNLPGSTPKRDLAMLKELFANPDYRPDYLKIYPLALVKSAPVYDWYKAGKFKPYSKKQLIDLLSRAKTEVPPYVRIERVIRDISAGQIVAGGAKVSNLRQMVLARMAEAGNPCRCIRCREVRSFEDSTFRLVRRDYDASGGREIFLSVEDDEGKTLYSLLRLRLPGGEPLLPALKSSALVRDIHTYGHLVAIGKSQNNAAQHRGYGRELLAWAEKIAKEEYGKTRIAIISGVGARGYFRKFGYRLKDSYMVKNLD